MSALLENLGIDWKLLLSQAVNFALLLVILRLTVYGPLLDLMKKRRERIEEGLAKADEADRRLREVGEIQKEKIKEAEAGGLKIIKAAESKGEEARAALLGKAAEEEKAMMKIAEDRIRAKVEESERKVRGEAARLVKAIIVKTVGLAPEAIDDALIEKAAQETRSNR